MKFLNYLREQWKKSPTVRVVTRGVVVAVAGYVAATLQTQDPLTLMGLYYAAATSLINGLLVVFTPAEPLVGPDFAKAEIEVPGDKVTSIAGNVKVIADAR